LLQANYIVLMQAWLVQTCHSDVAKCKEGLNRLWQMTHWLPVSCRTPLVRCSSHNKLGALQCEGARAASLPSLMVFETLQSLISRVCIVNASPVEGADYCWSKWWQCSGGAPTASSSSVSSRWYCAGSPRATRQPNQTTTQGAQWHQTHSNDERGQQIVIVRHYTFTWSEARTASNTLAATIPLC